MYDHLLHADHVTAALGRGDVQKAGTWTKSSGVSGEPGEQRPFRLPGVYADTSTCVSSYSRRALGRVSQVERSHAVCSPPEVCEQWCLCRHPLPCVLHLSTCSSRSGWPSPCGRWCLDTALCSAADEFALLLGTNEIPNGFHVAKELDHILARFEVSSIQCILSSSEQNSFLFMVY